MSLISLFRAEFCRTKKSLGQHFLENRHYLSRIADACLLSPTDEVLEIGPGAGALTEELLKRAIRVTAVEIDDNAAAFVAKHLPPVRLVHSDILTVDILKLFDAPVTVAGNLPYNVSVPILTHCTKYIDRVKRMVFMFQKEVAERICAKPKGKAYSSLSVFTEYHYNVSKLFDIGGGNFYPRTKVTSTALEFTPKERRRLPKDREEAFFDFVRLAFRHKRKTLSNNIGGLDEAFLRGMGLNPKVRAEELPLTAFLELFLESGQTLTL